MGLIRVTVTLRASPRARKKYEALFLVDTGATDSMAPASDMKKLGVVKLGRMTYELANGDTLEYDFGGAFIEFMGDITAGRVIFGPDGCEPILGVTALESVGITIDPVTQTLKRLPAIPLKCYARLTTPATPGSPRQAPGRYLLGDLEQGIGAF